MSNVAPPTYPKDENPYGPEVFLAGLIRGDLGIEVDPRALRMFVRARWSKLSPLAHSIHEG